MTQKRFVGIDWGSENHQVCVLDSARNVILERSFPHSGDGLHALVEAILDDAEPSDVCVAIEVSRGPIVETLLERGLAVHHLNPKQLDRFRDRYTVAGAKDDRRDAFVLADSLRTDPTAFRPAALSDPSRILLRELSRMHEELTQERVRLGNRLGDQLRRFFPQILALDSVHDTPWLWALLDEAPSPEAANKISLAKIATILRKHHIRRLQPADIRKTLRQRAIIVAEGVVAASSMHVASIIARLRLVREQLSTCGRRIKALLDELRTANKKTEHRDVAILLSLPGVGPIVGATMLTEAEQPLASRDYDTLRALSGVAPVTRASGKKSGKNATVLMRRACNARLRNAVHYWILTAIGIDPHIKARYVAQRARGHSHGRSVRSVADRMLSILMTMLRNGTVYEPRPLPS